MAGPDRQPSEHEPRPRRLDRWAISLAIGASALTALAQSPADRYPLPIRLAPLAHGQMKLLPPVESPPAKHSEMWRLTRVENELAALPPILQAPQVAGPEEPQHELPPPNVDPSPAIEKPAPTAETTPLASDPWLAPPAPGSENPNHAPDSLNWWARTVHEPLRPEEAKPLNLTLDAIITATLQHSNYVMVIKELPLLAETAITEADGRFDTRTFLDTKILDISDPVNNRLQTGNSPRLRNDQFSAGVGVRRLNPLGGQLEIGQEIGHQNTNSVFFDPKNQGTARFRLNYTQPLLRGAGREYNTSPTVLAQIEAGAAVDQVAQQLQDHLVRVTTAYWDLHLQRVNLLQKRRLLAQSQQIQESLVRRQVVDATKQQVLNANAAVNERKLDIIASEREIKAAENALRELVNDPVLGPISSNSTLELIPLDVPEDRPEDLDFDQSTETALQYRPEIARLIKQIRAAGVRVNIAKNEKRPQLNLFVDAYASGLRGNSNIGSAMADQFLVGEPSYTIGLEWERPIGNRAPQAAFDRSRLQLKQLEAQLQVKVQEVSREVAEAVLNVTTTYRLMQASYESMKTAEASVACDYDVWQTLPRSEQSTSYMLNELLESQEQLNAAEFDFVEAQRNYNVARVTYLKAIGTLLSESGVSVDRDCICNLPNLEFRRDPQPQQRDTRATVPASPPAATPATVVGERSTRRSTPPPRGATQRRSGPTR